MKKCPRCKKRKKLSSYYDPAQPYCKTCAREYTKEWQHKNSEKHRASVKAWQKRNPKYMGIWHRRSNERLKALIFTAYGGAVCKNCGIEDIRVLTLDHVRNDGSAERKRIKRSAGASFYRWLKRHGFPSGYQVLCRNCNWLRWLEGKRNAPAEENNSD